VRGRNRPAFGRSPDEVARAPIEECLRWLNAEPEGLSAAEARRRLARFGPNDLPAGHGQRLTTMFLSKFVHVLAVLLWIAALLAFVGGLPELGWAIIAVILINGLFSFLQEYRAGQLLAALRSQIPARALVQRGGQLLEIQAGELVPGDVIRLREGDRVPADCRLIAAAALEVDESSLTGESL
jgi:magnesium-transporting ATPase (P-type)